MATQKTRDPNAAATPATPIEPGAATKRKAELEAELVALAAQGDQAFADAYAALCRTHKRHVAERILLVDGQIVRGPGGQRELIVVRDA